MDKTAKCFDLMTADGKIIASLRIFDIQIVETKNGGAAAPKPEAAKNGGNGNTMTEAQQRKLFRVLAERGIEGEKALAHLKNLFGVKFLKEVPKFEASRMIDQLIKEVANGRPAGSSVS